MSLWHIIVSANKYTYIRVMAPVLDPTGSSGSISKVEVEAQLKQLLKELRVSAEVVALASFSPAPPPAVYPMGAVNAGKGKGDAAGAGSNVVRMHSGHAEGRKKAHMHQLSSLARSFLLSRITCDNRQNTPKQTFRENVRKKNHESPKQIREMLPEN